MKTKHCIAVVLFVTTVTLFVPAEARSQYYRYRHFGNPYRYSFVHPYLSIHFGGYAYRYQRGYLYRPYGSLFQLVVPPFGVRIAALPYGYSSFYLGANPYYYYNGIYYRPYAREYEVVRPPLGASVERLPRGSKVATVNGEKYYEYNGTYYSEQVDSKNRISYRVVGTDGVIDPPATTSEDAPRDPQIGDRIDYLPSDAKSVIINGERLYSTNSGLYYKKIKENRKVYYELVGK